jgi:hypothetical protein
MKRRRSTFYPQEDETMESSEKVEGNVNSNDPNIDINAAHNNGDDNFGFRPLEDHEDEKLKKQKVEDTAIMKETKEKIAHLLCQFPQLVPRTSHDIMQRLDQLSEKELMNVYANCMNDVTEFKGTPSSDFIIYLGTYFINTILPTFRERCLDDVNLKRDIESEMIHYLGRIGNKLNILFRLANNAYAAFYEFPNENQFKQIEDATNPEEEQLIQPIL